MLVVGHSPQCDCEEEDSECWEKCTLGWRNAHDGYCSKHSIEKREQRRAIFIETVGVGVARDLFLNQGRKESVRLNDVVEQDNGGSGSLSKPFSRLFKRGRGRSVPFTSRAKLNKWRCFDSRAEERKYTGRFCDDLEPGSPLDTRQHRCSTTSCPDSDSSDEGSSPEPDGFGGQGHRQNLRSPTLFPAFRTEGVEVESEDHPGDLATNRDNSSMRNRSGVITTDVITSLPGQRQIDHDVLFHDGGTGSAFRDPNEKSFSAISPLGRFREGPPSPSRHRSGSGRSSIRESVFSRSSASGRANGGSITTDQSMRQQPLGLGPGTGSRPKVLLG